MRRICDLLCHAATAWHTVVYTDIEADLEQVLAELVGLDDKDNLPQDFNVREDILAQHTTRATEIRQYS